MLHAIILYSVGSPDTLSTSCVKQYLDRFLSDKLVVRLPRFLWQPILHSFILRTRPERLIARYTQIFDNGQNPYHLALDQLCDAFETALTEEADRNAGKEGFVSKGYMVRKAYAFSEPGLNTVMTECVAMGANEITVVPLFPQYSDSTTRRPLLTIREFKLQCKEQRKKIKFHIVRSFGEFEPYLDAITNSILPELTLLIDPAVPAAEAGNVTLQPGMVSKAKAHVIFTFHGLPQSYIRLGDPYLNEVNATVSKLSARLNLGPSDYSLAFHSRIGPMAWLKPYLEDEVSRLLNEGITKLVVVAPGFSIDCLETLYDLNIKLRELFLHHGGESFTYIPALNADKAQVDMLLRLIEERSVTI